MSHHSIEHTMQYVTGECSICGESLLQTFRHVCFKEAMTDELRAVWFCAIVIVVRDMLYKRPGSLGDQGREFFAEWERQLFTV